MSNSKSGDGQATGKTHTVSPGQAEADDYKVGPGRPPRERRFRVGESGNPGGRPREPFSLKSLFREQFQRAFTRKAKLTQGDREREVTMFKAGMEQLAIKFAKGDRHARRDTFWVMEKLGGIDPSAPKNAFTEALAGDRQAILDAYVARQTGPKVVSAPSPILAPPELLDDDAEDERQEK
jgi:hypothetical protein